MSPNNFTQGHLIKTESLVVDVTAVGSLDRAEHTILGMIVAWRVFLPIQVVFVVGEPLCGIGTPS